MRTQSLGCSLVLGGLMIGSAGAATADDHGFYIGVDGGVSAYPRDLRVDLCRTIYKVDSVDSSDLAWAFTGGYRFNRFVAIEAGFSDLGQTTTQLVDASGDTKERGKIAFRTRGKTLSVLAHAPVGNWDPYVKVGAIQSIANLRVEAPIGEFGVNYTAEREETNLLIGLGARYAYSEQWALSFALDYYMNITAAPSARTSNIASPRIGFAYRF